MPDFELCGDGADGPTRVGRWRQAAEEESVTVKFVTEKQLPRRRFLQLLGGAAFAGGLAGLVAATGTDRLANLGLDRKILGDRYAERINQKQMVPFVLGSIIIEDPTAQNPHDVVVENPLIAFGTFFGEQDYSTDMKDWYFGHVMWNLNEGKYQAGFIRNGPEVKMNFGVHPLDLEINDARIAPVVDHGTSFENLGINNAGRHLYIYNAGAGLYSITDRPEQADDLLRIGIVRMQ
jgi:hypothetical protein